MDKVIHFIDKEENLVITANGDGYSYGAVLIPRFIGGYPHINRSSINTEGLDNSNYLKKLIISAITTQSGKNKENRVIVDDD